MSGGHFDYAQFRIDNEADELAAYISHCESGKVDEYGCKPDFSPATLARFRECEKTLRAAAAMLHRVDWLVSGDDSEETFHEQWISEIENDGFDREKQNLR